MGWFRDICDEFGIQTKAVKKARKRRFLASVRRTSRALAAHRARGKTKRSRKAAKSRKRGKRS